MGGDDAIALAFGFKRPRVRSDEGLTAREQEVARLVAEGLTNKEIAARLQLSVRTVESHVRHVLAQARVRQPHPARDLGASAHSVVDPWSR
jgi:DNA-binding NarL/FixJ family response regulator